MLFINLNIRRLRDFSIKIYAGIIRMSGRSWHCGNLFYPVLLQLTLYRKQYSTTAHKSHLHTYYSCCFDAYVFSPVIYFPQVASKLCTPFILSNLFDVLIFYIFLLFWRDNKNIIIKFSFLNQNFNLYKKIKNTNFHYPINPTKNMCDMPTTKISNKINIRSSNMCCLQVFKSVKKLYLILNRIICIKSNLIQDEVINPNLHINPRFQPI